MDEYIKLLNQCKSKEEETALYEMFTMIQALQKHDRLRNVYKNTIS